MKSLLLATLLSFAVLPAIHAQTESSGNSQFWQANLPGGNYLVSLNKISSVSMHTYIIDSELKVTEVIIDTEGNSLARFYYIIPSGVDAADKAGSRLVSRGEELLEQAGKKAKTDTASTAVKQYPTTTHAKTIEYSISSEANLKALFNSAKNAWMKGSGRVFTIKN